MNIKKYKILTFFTILVLSAFVANIGYCQDDDTTRNVLKQGLLGAGTGAIAAGASGGKAGQGALIGAGTGVIGSVLLDAITKPSTSSSSRRRAAPPPPQDEYYEDEQEGDYYYEEPPQESGTQKVLKQGLLGAGTGAIASGASGGNAGTGALIGAGTGVIGGALLDAMTQPSQPKRVYRRSAPRPQAVASSVKSSNVQVQEEVAGTEGGRKKILKKYDETGKLVSEEEIYY